MRATEHWSAIVELIDHLIARGLFPAGGRESVLEALRQREDQRSTGIGGGIAIPHAFSDDIDEVTAVFGRSREGIEFNALDNAPVHYVSALFYRPREQHNLHFRTSRLSGENPQQRRKSSNSASPRPTTRLKSSTSSSCAPRGCKAAGMPKPRRDREVDLQEVGILGEARLNPFVDSSPNSVGSWARPGQAHSLVSGPAVFPASASLPPSLPPPDLTDACHAPGSDQIDQVLLGHRSSPALGHQRPRGAPRFGLPGAGRSSHPSRPGGAAPSGGRCPPPAVDQGGAVPGGDEVPGSRLRRSRDLGRARWIAPVQRALTADRDKSTTTFPLLHLDTPRRSARKTVFAVAPVARHFADEGLTWRSPPAPWIAPGANRAPEFSTPAFPSLRRHCRRPSLRACIGLTAALPARRWTRRRRSGRFIRAGRSAAA
ncbi:MAG: PTS sugar transporter subunit IIA [Akkermansiaceae bacterium]|nr:PTS sugar transporter subunit IIA [Akkermansiaceae bacterium]